MRQSRKTVRNINFLLSIVLTILSFLFCPLFATAADNQIDYRREMREFVIRISDYAKQKKPGFAVIPQNGHPLLTDDGSPEGDPASAYLSAIDGIGQESLFFGYNGDEKPTPDPVTSYTAGLLKVAAVRRLPVLVTDYCSKPENVKLAYSRNSEFGFLSFAADSRGLDRIPTYPPQPYDVHDGNVELIASARNFLYLINPGKYKSPASYLEALGSTEHDIIVTDLFFRDSRSLTQNDVISLQKKPSGGRRLVIAYMSIGEAESYRYYWKPAWRPGYPSWLGEENPQWEGNYKVRYWDPEWQLIIFGNADAYLDRIIAAGFDGVYLDIIDAFEYFEEKEKSKRN